MDQRANSLSLQKPTKVIAVIPCLNEEKYIADIIRTTRKYVNQVIVVDDGSSDNTAKVAEAEGAIVIRHHRPTGAGAATRSGIQAALANNADIVVTLDGDGQHNPDEIPLLIAPIKNDKADLVIGSRFLKPVKNSRGHFLGIGSKFLVPTESIKGYRRLGIGLITFLYNFGSKAGLSDTQCCFRAYNRKLLETIKITINGFGFSVETLIQARKKNFRFVEVPVTCIYHDDGSTLNPLVHGVSVALDVIKLRIFG